MRNDQRVLLREFAEYVSGRREVMSTRVRFVDMSQLIIDLLDETEPKEDGREWRVSETGIVAHLVNQVHVPLCGYREDGRWRVVTNASPCEGCASVLRAGAVTS